MRFTCQCQTEVLRKISIEYIGISVTIYRDKCDITEYPGVTNYT